MLECVVNVSEGADTAVLDALRVAVGPDLLDVHSDVHHNRSVFTLVGENAPRALTEAALRLLSLEHHSGVHPRVGVVDVVPFVPLAESTMDDALLARKRFAEWATDELGVPSFLYGPERSLPSVRKDAWKTLFPHIGPQQPHPTAGALCVGAREPLIAYNVWLQGISLADTRDIAARVRTEHIRTLGLQVGDFTQVSVNLVSPKKANPIHVVDAVKQHTNVHHCELVGLLPDNVLRMIPQSRWEELDLSEERTIEWRLANRQR
jgi:glutamate formiminotransferase